MTVFFLDILICKNDNLIETEVYRKSTNNDIYLIWNAFSLDTWKRATLKTLVECAHIVRSIEEFLHKELIYLEKVFHENNNYPKYVIKQILKQSLDDHNKQEFDMASTNLNLNDAVEERNVNEENQLLLVPCQSKKGDFVITYMKKRIKICYQLTLGQKQSSLEVSLAKIAQRILERVKDHTGKDVHLHFFKHANERGHEILNVTNCSIIGKEY